MKDLATVKATGWSGTVGELTHTMTTVIAYIRGLSHFGNHAVNSFIKGSNVKLSQFCQVRELFFQVIVQKPHW